MENFLKIHIALGSSISPRQQYLESAEMELSKLPYVKSLRKSAVYKTSPIGPSESFYLNMAMELEVDTKEVNPHQFLEDIHTIENGLGRKRSVKWGDRTIDIDIILWGDETINQDHLTIPHPHMNNRDFVLKPLLDIAPDTIHPASGKSISSLYNELKRSSMFIKIGIASFNPFPGDLKRNSQKIIEVIEDARIKGVELLLLPEMSLPGYCIGDLHSNPKFLEEQHKIINNIILPETHGITVILGATILDESRKMATGATGRFNGFLVLKNGKIIGKGKKSLLADEGVLEDSRYFLLGEEEEIKPVVMDFGEKGRLSAGILVCQDIWDDNATISPAKILKNKGADLLLVLNSSPFHIYKQAKRVETALRRATENNLPLLYSNTVGIQDIGKNIVIFDGSSFIINDNALLKSSTPFEEELLITNFNNETKTISPDSHKNNQNICSHGFSPVECLEKALIFTLKQFFERSKVFKGAVLGLSGGIDSAVDALLVSKAIGPENLLLINMPSRFNSASTKSIAQKIASALKSRYIVHPIEEAVNLKIRNLESILGKPPLPLTCENIQARERGNILMEYSQETGYMVIGNGNKTEFQRGYATLYGDILGAIMPLGDVPKLMVFDLATQLDPEHEIIPEELLTLKPSAELSENHDVEAGKGDPFDYFIESPMGVEIVEKGRSVDELGELFNSHTLDPNLWIADRQGVKVYDKLTREEFQEYAKSVEAAIRRSYFKRVQAPPIPVVSPKAFGLDFRESLFPPPLYK